MAAQIAGQADLIAMIEDPGAWNPCRYATGC